MITDMNKLFELGARVYNNKMKIENNEDGTVKYSDDEAIRALCAKIFDKDGNISSMEDLSTASKRRLANTAAISLACTGVTTVASRLITLLAS